MELEHPKDSPEEIRDEMARTPKRCSAKDCNNRGIFFEKLVNAQLGGWFCKSCRDQLKALGIFSQE
jgi:hypothetical protein